MKYMVAFTFLQQEREAILAHLPEEQTRAKELQEQGLVEATYLATDQSRGWLVMLGASEEHVRQAFTSLPLNRYMQWEMTSLT